MRQEYETGVQITQIFKVGVLGFQSHRDDFAISFAEKEMRRRLAEFVNPAVTDDDLSRRYGLKDNRDWSLSHARKAALEEQNDGVMKVDYRPFDTRWGEFSEIAMDYPRRELLDHVAHRDNQCLNVVRQTKARNWQHVLVSDKPTPAGFIEIKDGSTVFPLRLFRWSGTGDEVGENFKTEFRSFVDSRYARHYLPEEILGYIYAVLHAPFYRTRYSEFLRTNFPRIPFAEMPADFIALSKLGWQLVDAHLLRDVPQRGFAQYNGKGDHAVEAVRYSQVEQAIWINASQRFAPVPQNVWDFHIGGYRVLEKYLKSRKGRKLSLDEINHVAQVADSLAFTIEQMAKIDTAYKAAFPDRG
ncbi:MAG TPA: type ISP restriction/modification enzyme [Rhizomicrobium sp.]